MQQYGGIKQISFQNLPSWKVSNKSGKSVLNQKQDYDTLKGSYSEK